MHRKSIISFIFCALFVLFFAACDNSDEQCREDNYVMMKVNFYKAVIDTLGVQSISTLTLDSLTVRGQGIDSLLYNNHAIYSVDLPLRKFENYSEFVFSLNDTIEMLKVWHHNIEEYLSFECGCLTTHVIDSFAVSNNFIDSASIINPGVNTSNAENIQLYRHYNLNK